MEQWQRFHPLTIFTIIAKQFAWIVLPLSLALLSGIFRGFLDGADLNEMLDPSVLGDINVFGLFVMSYETLFSLIIAIVFCVALTVQYFNRVWRMDDTIIEMKYGFLRKHHLRINRNRIQNIMANTTVFGRLSNTTSLTISSADSIDITLAVITSDQAKIIRQVLLPSQSAAGIVMDTLQQAEFASSNSSQRDYADRRDRRDRHDQSSRGPAKLTGQTVVVSQVSTQDWLISIWLNFIPTLIIIGAFCLIATVGLIGYQMLTEKSFYFVSIFQNIPMAVIVPGLFLLGSIFINEFREAIVNFDFVAMRDGVSLRVERGMLSRLEGTVEIKRIQQVTVERPFFFRLLGREAIKISTASIASDTDNPDISTIVPIQPTGQYQQLISELLLASVPSQDDLEPSDKATVKHGLLLLARASLVMAIILLVINYFIPAMWLVFFFYFALFVTVGVVFAFWRKAAFRWSLTEELFVVQRGILRQRITAMPVRLIQSVTISQTRLQKRFNLCSVMADVAGRDSVEMIAQDLNLRDGVELYQELINTSKPYTYEDMDGV